MDRRAITAAVVIVTAVAALASALWTARETREFAQPVAVPTNDSADPEELALSAPEDGTTERTRSPIASTRVTIPRTETSTRGLEVEVRLPGGVPDDDEPHLLAQFSPFEDAFDSLLRGDERAPPGGSVHFLRLPDTAFREAGTRCVIPADGRIRIAVPSDARRALLLVQSHFLFLEPRLVALDEEELVRLEPTLGAWVTGHVLLPDAREFAPEYGSVRMELIGAPRTTGGWSDCVSLSPTVRGRFELGALDSARTYFLRTSYDGPLLAPPEQELHFAPGERRELEVVLEPGASVSGCVTDGEGEPIAKASVSVAEDSYLLSHRDGRSAYTDARGRYSLTCVPAGEVTLHVRLDAEVVGTHELELGPGEARSGVDLRVELGAISGTVLLPAGVPAERALVRITESSSGFERSVADAQCDERGRFVFDRLARGDYGLAALATLHAGSDSTAVYGVAHREGIATGSREVEVVLSPAPVLCGVVRDGSGAPVESFDLELDSVSPRPVSLLGGDWRDYIAPGGVFRIQAPEEGEWRLRVTTPDLGSWVQLVRVPTIEPVVVVLAAAPARVRGRIVDPTGAAIAGGVVFFPERYVSSSTEPDGSFDLEVPDGMAALVGCAEGFADSAPVPLVGEGGELLVRLRVGMRIEGRVLDRDGKSLAARRVWCAEGHARGKDGGGKNCRSDGAGRFAFEHVTPGRVRLHVEYTDDEYAYRDVLAVDGETLELDICRSEAR